MADLNIKCPSCGQEMVCDDAYAGQEVQCPGCHKNVAVPKPSSNPRNPLVPKVPEATKLAIGTKDTHGKGAAAQASHPLNLRKTTGGPRKKKLPIKDIAIYTFLVAVLGAGGYFGYDYWQKKKAAEETATSSKAPDAPAAAPANPEAPGAPPSPAEVAPGADLAQAAAGEAPKPAEKPLPVIPPAYSLESAFARIPQGRVNGTISGGNFVAETIRLEQTPTSQVLRFSQGTAPSVDRELLVYLKARLTDLTNGYSVEIASDKRGSGLPQVMKRWRTNPTSKYAPSSKTFGYGYVMKLELGKPADGQIPGKLYVALPDKEETVVAGLFKIPLPNIDPNQMAVPGMAYPMPGMAPPGGVEMPAAEQEAFRRRYGTGAPAPR